MPPGEGGSTSGNVVDGHVPSRRRKRLSTFNRSKPEKINPGNLKFEHEVAMYMAKKLHQQHNEQITATIIGSIGLTVYDPPAYVTFLDGHGEIRTWNDDIRDTSTPPVPEDSTQQGKGRPLNDSAKPPADNTDFLEGTFFKINLDKQKGTAKNKKSSKKQKKKKAKGKGGRKQSHASEMPSEPPTDPSSSSSPVAINVPLLEYSSSSSSSQVTEKIVITSAVNSASSGNEKELSASTSSNNDDFKSFKSTTSYATAPTSSSVNDFSGSLSDARSERSLSASDSTDSRDLKKTSVEGDKQDVHQSFSLAVGSGCTQEALLCSNDYASNDGDFQKVVSRKSAQKMRRRMQRVQNSAPSSTMAASGSIITRELVTRAPCREVITIGHYINDDTFYGQKPNKKKGKYQKARSWSNLSKTGYAAGGDEVSGSNRVLAITTTVHPAKPRSSDHVTLEAIEETNSPRCLPKEGELKAMSPVGDGIKNTDSNAPSDKSSLGSLANSSCANREEQEKVVALVDGDTEDIRAPSSDYPSSLGHVDNSSCLDKEEQKKAVALVGGGTEDIDSRAPTSGKTSSLLGQLVNSTCVDREEQKKKTMALVGAGTEDIDSRASSTSDKTSSLGHLVNSSCVDREEQKKAMSPVAGETKDNDSRAASSDKTLSLCHRAISSCAHSKEQKKEESRIALSTHASSVLDKITKAANNAYEIQAACDVYMISGIHADIENFLHAATPVVGQISCTKSSISLQDQRLWSIWSSYEEPECCGIEVQMQGKKDSIWPEFSTYFQPLLSAVQLFEQSGKSQNHGGLIFQYMEMENPYSRPPIFTRIKQLRDGVKLSGNPIFGDPKQLETVKLSDLHPASWFSVAWYPICQIPAAAGSCKASFLTYHCLGKLVPQTFSMDKADGRDRIICPIVGLLGYRDQGATWFLLREQLRFKPTPNFSSITDHAELLNKRLMILRQGASIISKAVVPRASGGAMIYHSDYEFFFR